jgi:hypothetical protein
MAEQKHLWVFQDFEKNMTLPLGVTGHRGGLPSVGPAPMLRPEFTNDDIFEMFQKRFDTQSYTVNVLKDFAWTSSPRNDESVGDVPEMQMRELNVEFNPFVNQILNNVAVIDEGVARAAAGGKGMIESLISSFNKKEEACHEQGGSADNKSKDPKGKEDSLITKGLDFLSKTSKSLSQKKLKQFKTKIPLNDPDWDPMAPYERLYETSPTGWKYKLPFFDDSFRTVSSGWSGASSNSVLSTIGNIASQGAQLMQNMNFLEPGVYIEQPGSFQFSGRNKSFTVSFPLINTHTYDDLIKNWQLIFLLTYQNLPNRVSRSIILPPVIYETLIPGMWYSKYSYISNLTVSFIGARRKMKLRIPTLTKNVLDDFLIGQTDISTVIPDAYNVTMTVTELFGETQNHMYTALKKRHLNSKVRTGDMDASDSILGDLVGNIGGSAEGIGDIVDTAKDAFKKFFKKDN